MSRHLPFIVLVTAILSGCGHLAPSGDKLTPPEAELAGELYSAIWKDLQSNALIGNGNELAARWANAGGNAAEAPLLHIQNLLCSGGEAQLRCRFDLLRDGGIAPYLGQPVPDRLTCSARFRRSGDQWSIPRLPPAPGGGHSRITIRCQPVA